MELEQKYNYDTGMLRFERFVIDQQSGEIIVEAGRDYRPGAEVETVEQLTMRLDYSGCVTAEDWQRWEDVVHAYNALVGCVQERVNGGRLCDMNRVTGSPCGECQAILAGLRRNEQNVHCPKGDNYWGGEND